MESGILAARLSSVSTEMVCFKFRSALLSGLVGPHKETTLKKLIVFYALISASFHDAVSYFHEL